MKIETYPSILMMDNATEKRKHLDQQICFKIN